MDKAILVIDMPTCCRRCMCYVIGPIHSFCKVTKFEILNGATIPYHCPLKFLPDKRDERGTWTVNGYIEDGYSNGWNDCIDEILRNEER